MDSKKNKVVDTRPKDIPEEESLLAEAKSRFRDCDTYYSDNISEARNDLMMLAGKNHWPDKVVKEREAEGRPVLTINMLPKFCDQVTGDSRLNRISIKVTPYGGGATKGMADNLAGIIRNIENVSHADVAYQTAEECAVNNGFGYFRLNTGYDDDDSFDQSIRIERIRNPFTVFLDPAHTEADGRDSRYGFVTEMVSREEYEARYPDKTLSPWESQGQDSTWSEKDRVRIAEYWVKRPQPKRLLLLSDGRTVSGEKWDKIKDELEERQKTVHLVPNAETGQVEQVEGPAPPDSGYQETILNPLPTVVRERKVDGHKVVMYLIDGTQIISGPHEWAGRWIPIIPVWGKEIVIDDRRYLRSVIRHAKDSQRMYNYFRSAATETVALAPKAPYIAEEKQLEGHEEDWGSCNTKNLAVLLYRHQPGVPMPNRQVVTQTALGEITEANIAHDEMKSTTSIHDPSLGAKSNETSGRAIIARQRESDVANTTYHDNLRRAIQFAGEQLIDLIPKIYDTTRQIAVSSEDGRDELVVFNETVFDDESGQEVILNDLSLGKYKVLATSGPSFTTARVEAAESMIDFVRVAPNAAVAMIDIIAENMDWPGAQRIAKRLKKIMPAVFNEEEDGVPPQPQSPDPDQMIKMLKAEGIELGNTLKRLDIADKKGETSEQMAAVAKSSAEGVLRQLTDRGGKQ